MRNRALIGLAVILSLGFASAALAASADDFNAAYAKAEAASKEAHALKNEWIVADNPTWKTTAQGLKAAKAEAADGKFDEAVKTVREVEALANGEIAQAKEQKKLWTDAVIR